MRVGKVIGTVTPGKIHPLLISGQLKIVVPFSFDELTAPDQQPATVEEARRLLMERQPKNAGREIIVYDELSVGIGEWIAFSEGAEAAMPFYPEKRPVDAYAAAILDTLELDSTVFPDKNADEAAAETAEAEDAAHAEAQETAEEAPAAEPDGEIPPEEPPQDTKA